MRLVRSALALSLSAMLSLAACGGDDAADQPALETRLDPTRNVVTASPEPFAPAFGGIGVGKASLGTGDPVPTARVTISEAALKNVGETDCGQFAPDSAKDLEIKLYAALTTGTFQVTTASGVEPGKAQITFRGRLWNEGEVVIESGDETRGGTVRGRLKTTTREGEALELTFETLFHGCGRG